METKLQSKLRLACVITASIGFSGCAGVETSKYSYSSAGAVNQPQKSSDCYDAAVLLGKNYNDSKEIARKVLVGLDASIDSDSGDVLKAHRNHHVGLMVGSGGEDLTVTIKKVDDLKSFVTATTKTGFVGGAGQKAWSCQIVDDMVKMAR